MGQAGSVPLKHITVSFGLKHLHSNILLNGGKNCLELSKCHLAFLFCGTPLQCGV